MARWNIDPDHSVAAFAVRHMMLFNVRGQFNAVSGSINFDPSNIAASRVEATIGASGIYTGNKKRDDHLRSPDFFDTDTYPTINFKSTKLEERGGKRFAVTGDLTIRGITKEVMLDAEFCDPVKDPFEEGTSIGFAATTVIDRESFGLAWNVPMDAGGVMVGREVSLFLDVEADLVSQ